MTASPVSVRVNPNDVAQRYVLWGNGRIDPYGGAAPITGAPTWYDSMIPMPVAVALHITDWATPAGYVLDLFGAMHPFGGAPDLASGNTYAGLPYTPNVRTYVDWAWKPDGSGHGYALDLWGRVYPFGGATVPPRSGPRWTQPFAKKLAVNWGADLRAITLDAYGGLHPDFNAVVGTLSVYWPHQDNARDFAVTDWATGSGHVLDLFGGVHEFGNAPDTWGWPYRPGGDVARCFVVLSASDPFRGWEVWSGGQQYEFVSSSPPQVVAGGSPVKSPPQITTTTTRPTLAWSYGDLQNDRPTLWQVLVFTQEFASTHIMDDPFQWQADALVVAAGTDPTSRGYVPEIDFPNGDYVMFVAVQDSAGQWSAWSDYAWTQNVPTPAAPTGLTAVPDEATFSVALSATATNDGDVLLYFRFDCSDDGELTWAPVRGGDAIPLPGTTITATATDWDIPLGVERTYRAVVYSNSPRVTSSPSATATATVPTLTYVLTAVDDPTLGGRVNVQEPVEWTRPVVAGVFEGLDADYPTVVKDGSRPKSRRSTVHVFAGDEAAWQLVEALAMSRSTLVYRDPFGSVRYCELVGDWSAGLMPGAATRHMHTTDLPLVEVRPPHLAA